MPRRPTRNLAGATRCRSRSWSRKWSMPISRPCATSMRAAIGTSDDVAITRGQIRVSPPLLFDLAGKRVYVAGHTGMAGSAIARRLASEGCDVLPVDHATVDLIDQHQAERWLDRARPHAVFLAAGRVGGIRANSTF